MTKKQIDWDAVSIVADRGVITARELDELGVPRQTVSARAAAGGPWTRLLPGVLLLSTGPPTPDQRLDAALRYAGPGAMLTGLPAARLHGSKRFAADDRVHVLLPAERKRLGTGFVDVERTRRLPKPVSRNGFRTAPEVRALLDAARRFTRLDPVRALLAEPVQAGRVAPTELAAELRAGSRRGTALCRTVLAELLADVHSPAESWAYRLVRDSDLPAMRWNVRLLDGNGDFLAKPDAWIDHVAMAWEIDSREFHLSPAEYDATLRRNARLTAAGVVLVQTLPSRIRRDPRGVLAELRAAYHQARRRPRPPVVAL